MGCPSGCNVVEEGFSCKETGIWLHLRITSFRLRCRVPSFSGRPISAAFVGARILSALSYFMIRARALHATGAALTSAGTSCEWQPSVKDTLIDPDKSKFRAAHKIFCERRALRTAKTGLHPKNQRSVADKGAAPPRFARQSTHVSHVFPWATSNRYRPCLLTSIRPASFR